MCAHLKYIYIYYTTPEALKLNFEIHTYTAILANKMRVWDSMVKKKPNIPTPLLCKTVETEMK